MRSFVRSLIPASIGGLVVAAVLLLTGAVGDDDPPRPAAAPAAPSVAVAEGQATGLTAREIYKRDARGVVLIQANVVERQQSPFGFPQQREGESSGSGFVVDRDGSILTNFHVVEGADRVTVSFDADGGAPERARVVGTDPSNDLALLKVDPDGLDLHPLALGDSRSVQVGDPALAIGNPFGRDRTLTTGVVSAVQRRIEAPNGFPIENAIQTDAAINPGNSGGPLLDGRGRVIGINSQIETGGQSGGFVGLGFAVAIDTAKDVLGQLRQGTVRRPYLGVSGADVDGRLARLGLAVKRGVLVQTVQPGSPADRAGIRAGESQVQGPDGAVVLGGDVITEVEGRPVRSMDEVAAAVARKKPGDELKLSVQRGDRTREVTVKLGTRPSRAPSS